VVAATGMVVVVDETAIETKVTRKKMETTEIMVETVEKKVVKVETTRATTRNQAKKMKLKLMMLTIVSVMMTLLLPQRQCQQQKLQSLHRPLLKMAIPLEEILHLAQLPQKLMRSISHQAKVLSQPQQ